MEIRNSSITNRNFQIGAGATANPAKHSVTFDGARLVSKENNANWLKAENNTETACIHLASGGVTMEARHNVKVSAVMDGAGGMTKTGSGTLALASGQLYAGATIVSNGTLVVASGADIAGPVVVADGGILSVADNATVFSSFTLKAGGLVAIPAYEGNSVDLFAVSGPITLEHDMYDHGSHLFIKNAQNGTRIVRYGRNPGVMIMLH
jgi:autotransporter-associated beta strand protein